MNQIRSCRDCYARKRKRQIMNGSRRPPEWAHRAFDAGAQCPSRQVKSRTYPPGCDRVSRSTDRPSTPDAVAAPGASRTAPQQSHHPHAGPTGSALRNRRPPRRREPPTRRAPSGLGAATCGGQGPRGRARTPRRADHRVGSGAARHPSVSTGSSRAGPSLRRLFTCLETGCMSRVPPPPASAWPAGCPRPCCRDRAAGSREAGEIWKRVTKHSCQQRGRNRSPGH